MNYERSDILRPSLDNLELKDQTLFSRNIALPILTRLASQGLQGSSMAAELIFQGFRDELTKRADDILSEMRRILKGVYIEAFDKLAEGIGITKLAYDAGPQNPTAARLIEDILDPHADGLREKLKARFAVPIKPGLVPGGPPTKEDLAVRKKMERK